MRRGIRVFALACVLAAAGIGLALRGPVIAQRPAGETRYEYGQLTTVYSAGQKKTASWTWEGPMLTVNGESAAVLFEKLSKTEKKDARKIDVLNWLGSQGWGLVISQKETMPEEKEERVLTQYLFRRP